MPVTAVYGEGVYGQSSYGVLLSQANTDFSFETTGVLLPFWLITGESLLSFDVSGKMSITLLGNGGTNFTFSTSPILVNFPYPTDTDAYQNLYYVT